MVLDAIVKEDGTLVAKAPKSLCGKKVKITIHEEKSQQQKQKKLSQWEKMSAALEEIDALDLPQREFSDILADLRKFKETE